MVLYGASGVNCSLFGMGKHYGNTPLEAMVFDCAATTAALDGTLHQGIPEKSPEYQLLHLRTPPHRTGPDVERHRPCHHIGRLD